MYEDAELALAAWSWPSTPQLKPNRDGLINETYAVSAGHAPVAVLQRLNTKIFVPQVHEDIEAVTGRLRERGVPTPSLLRTRRGGLWHEAPDGAVWRCLTHMGNRTIHKVRSLRDARSAGALVARFHAAVTAFPWSFRCVRAGAHDTSRHMEMLAEAVDLHAGHRLRDEVAPVAQEVLSRWDARTSVSCLPRRIVHGDLKISNVRFEDDAAHCLIDLDTMAHETLEVELGDAMRSWCNPASEDADETQFDLGVFEAAMQGYASGWGEGPGPSEEEWDAIVPGVERIALELSARFARDALEECYFGWDPRFGTRGDHNLLRARGQLALARSITTQRAAARGVIDAARRASAVLG